MQKEKQKITLSKRAAVIVVLIFAVVSLVFVEAAYNYGVIGFSPTNYLETKLSTRAYNDETCLVRFLDVGQGDCTIIKVKDKCAVIDFGLEDDYKRVYKELKKLGVENIDVAFITHLHKDHIGGFLNTVKLIDVDNIVVNKTAAEDFDKEQATRFFNSIEKYNINQIIPVMGDTFHLGEANIKVLYKTEKADDENNRSVALLLSIDEFTFLFTGDGEKDFEKELIRLYPNLTTDVLKLGHHGSATSTSEEFIRQINPVVTVASCGYNNLYNHPSDEVISRLNAEGIKYYRTDLDGSITVTFDENRILVNTERQQNE
jgi:competence protein ComEC